MKYRAILALLFLCLLAIVQSSQDHQPEQREQHEQHEQQLSQQQQQQQQQQAAYERAHQHGYEDDRGLSSLLNPAFLGSSLRALKRRLGLESDHGNWEPVGGSLHHQPHGLVDLSKGYLALAPALRDLTHWHPVVDVSETEDKILIHAELPGADKNDIRIELRGDTLTLTGQRKSEKVLEEEDKDHGRTWHLAERFYGRFTRAMKLPAAILEKLDANDIKATFKDGVLEITVPKKEPTPTHRLTIE